MRLFFIRHGQTEANTDHALDTAEPGTSLTDLGVQQSFELPKWFEDIDLDMIVTSNLTRTHETARELARAKGLVPVVDPRIREIVAGDLEMKTDHNSIVKYHVTVDEWSEGKLHLRMPGAESGHEVLDRVDEAVRDAGEAVGNNGTIAMIAHGALIRLWSRVRGNVANPDDFPYLRNTEIVELRASGPGWTIVRRMNSPEPSQRWAGPGGSSS